jgi:hypothetical protein
MARPITAMDHPVKPGGDGQEYAKADHHFASLRNPR